jgi:aspartyl-tRNA synthetase
MWRWIELVSGGTRIADKNLLIQRMQEKGMNPEGFKYHLQAFDYGMPPHTQAGQSGSSGSRWF